MAWLFQGVLNAGLQILLSIFGGWLCARLKLVDPDVMSRNVNAFAMKAAYPAFIIHLLGVKTDLRDADAWRALGVFVLWVVLIQLACLVVHKARGSKRSSVMDLGLNCLLLTTNNTGCIGWPVLIATVGQQSAVLSMLLGVLFFILLLPVATCCFEYSKWEEQQQGALAGTRHSSNGPDDTRRAADQLPVAAAKTPPALPAPDTSFPHEFRYCYWSNELYRPNKPAYKPLPQASCIQVYVDSGGAGPEDDAADHHCFGGSAAAPPGRSSGSGGGRQPAPTAPATGREWWRAGRATAAAAEGGGLKRAKDSCDSLYTPFAAAACAEKQQQAEGGEQVPRPATLGLSTLTRRLSRGLSTAAAAASAAAAAAQSGLARAASLHTAGSLQKKAAAAPLKKAGSIRRQAGGAGRGGAQCQMSVPLMSNAAPSCCPSHAAEGPPCAPRLEHAASGGAGALSDAAIAAAVRAATADGSDAAAAASPAPTAVAAAVRLSRLPGSAGLHAASDSAVELHTMCDSLGCRSNDPAAMAEGSPRPHAGCGAAQPASAGGCCEPPGGLHASSSSGSLHYGSFLDERVGRFDSSTGRVSSRTQLLPTIASSTNICHMKGPSNLGRPASPAAAPATAAVAAAAAAPDGAPKRRSQRTAAGLGCSPVAAFARAHPLLCHIAATQAASFHLWLNVAAIALSVSGARAYLDPASPLAIPALGFVDGVLGWFSAACIPTLLFANGVWMCGKDVLCGGWRGQAKVLSILALKLTLLPALMLGLTLLCGVRGAYGLSLVLLASCPLAPLAFLVCQQYGHGAELATAVTIQGVLLMLPQMMAVIKVNELGGMFNVKLLA